LPTGSSESVFVTIRSAMFGVAVGVKVDVAVGVLVGVAVFVGVGVIVGVLVAVGVNVAVGVDVFVGVAVAVFVGVNVGVAVCVAVAVGVFVAVGVAVLVNVGVTVGVFVLVGVAVGARTVVSSLAVLFVSKYSTIRLFGSTTAVFVNVSRIALVRWPVIVMSAKAPAPVPNDPRSQSSVPPVIGPTIAQLPRLVVKPTKVKFAGGLSIIRTSAVPSEPMFRTSIS